MCDGFYVLWSRKWSPLLRKEKGETFRSSGKEWELMLQTQDPCKIEDWTYSSTSLHSVIFSICAQQVTEIGGFAQSWSLASWAQPGMGKNWGLLHRLLVWKKCVLYLFVYTAALTGLGGLNLSPGWALNTLHCSHLPVDCLPWLKCTPSLGPHCLSGTSAYNSKSSL